MRRILIISLLLINIFNISAQDKVFENFKNNYQFYWKGAKYLLGKTKINPIVSDIIEKSLPKIAEKDIKGAIKEISIVFYEKKNIKVLNPQYTSYLETNFKSLIDYIENKRWGQISLILCDIALVTNNYFINNNLNDGIKINDIVDQKTIDNIDKKIFVNRFNDYFFYYKTDGVFLDMGDFVREAGESKDKYNDGFLITNYDTTQTKYIVYIEKNESKYANLKYYAEPEYIRTITEPFTESGVKIEYISSEYITINNRKFLKQTYLQPNWVSTEGFNIVYYCIIDKFLYKIGFQVDKKDLLKYSLEFELILNNLIFNY